MDQFIDSKSEAGPLTQQQQMSGQIQAVLGLAIRAPSGDNAQPWHFKLNANIVDIGIDHALAQHTFNNRHHASLVSVGMLVESIVLASPEYGLHADVQWLAEDFQSLDKNSPWVRVAFTSTLPSNETKWQSAIQSRTTQRGDFSATGVVLSHSKFNFVKQSDFPLVSSSVLSGEQVTSSETLTRFIIKSEQYLFNNPSALRDFFQWVRFKKHEESTNDGMSWRTLGLKPSEAMVFKASKSSLFLQKILSPFFKVIIAKQTESKLARAGGVVLLSAKAATPQAAFEAGRLAMHHWLRLEQLGLAVQPLSAASLCVFDVACGATPASMPASYKVLYRNGLGILMDAFCLNPGETPIWMYRFGQLTQKPAEGTPRRDLSSFIKDH